MQHPLSFQEVILSLQEYWSAQGCAIVPPYDMEVGAGTFHPATTLRSLGPQPWRAAYLQPCRRPSDGRYGENPNRLQHYYQFQVILKPAPDNIRELYLNSLAAIGLNAKNHDIRFVEDDWESPTLGAWGLGWEVWCDGMEVTQFTYFQQVAGIECDPVSGEITYGLERLCMFLQGVDSVYDLRFNQSDSALPLLYRDIYHRDEVEYSHYNFQRASVADLLSQFEVAEKECLKLLCLEDSDDPTSAKKLNAEIKENAATSNKIPLARPAYDQCIKASHVFNLLDARGAISVTARQDYILRVRKLASACGLAWINNMAPSSYDNS